MVFLLLKLVSNTLQVTLTTSNQMKITKQVNNWSIYFYTILFLQELLIKAPSLSLYRSSISFCSLPFPAPLGRIKRRWLVNQWICHKPIVSAKNPISSSIHQLLAATAGAIPSACIPCRRSVSIMLVHKGPESKYYLSQTRQQFRVVRN